MSIRPWVLLAAAGALALSAQPAVPALPAPSRAADTWGPVHRFERDPFGESLTVGPGDVTTVAWGSQQRWPEPVKVQQRTATGRWLAPVTLGVGHDPVVATDGAGNLTVAWVRDRQGITTGVWVARKPVGSPWTRPVHVSDDRAAPGYPDGGSTYGATGLDVAMSGGAAVVTWLWGNWEREVPFRVQAVYRSAHGRWSAAHALTAPPAWADDAHAVLGRDGTAWVAYDRSPVTGPTRVEVRSRPASGGWGPAERVGRGTLGEVGVTGRGDVSVVYRGRGRVRVVEHPAGGAWQAPYAVTPPDVSVRDWSVSLNPGGAGVVAYLRHHHRVAVVRRALGGDWTAPVDVAGPGIRLAEVFTAVNPAGDVFVGWDNSYGLWGRYRPARRGWAPATTAQPDTGVDVLESVRAQVLPGGDPVLLWAQEERPLRARVLAVH